MGWSGIPSRHRALAAVLGNDLGLFLCVGGWLIGAQKFALILGLPLRAVDDAWGEARGEDEMERSREAELQMKLDGI